MSEETNSTKKIVAASRPPLPPSRVNNHQVCLTKHVPKLDIFQKAFLTEESDEEEFDATHPATSCASPAAYSLSSMSSLSSDETDNISCAHSFLDERVTYNSPQRKQKVNVMVQSPTVPSHLSPFYPVKYLALGCEERSNIDFLRGTAENTSTTVTKFRVSSLATEFLNIKNLCYFILLVTAASELLLCCRPHLPLLSHKEHYLEAVASGTSTTNDNTNSSHKIKLISFISSVLIQQKSKIFDAIEMSSLHKIYELYHDPQAYYYSSQSKTTTRWPMPIVGCNTRLFISDSRIDTLQSGDIVHLIFLIIWFAHYSRMAWSRLQQQFNLISYNYSHKHEEKYLISSQNRCRSLVVKAMNRALFSVLKTLYFCLILSTFLLILPIFEERVKKSAPSFVNFGVPRKIVSLLDIFLLSSFQWFHNVVIESAQRRAVTFCFKNLMRKAIANPAKFIHRFKQLLACIRYAKFLAPLIGQCNKLRGHASDLVKQWNQRLCILKAQTEWKFLMRRISVQRKTNRVYAKIMQKVQERRDKKMLAVIQRLREASLNSSKKMTQMSNSSEDSSSVAKAYINAWLYQKTAHARKRAAEQCASLNGSDIESGTEKNTRKRCKIMSDEERALLGMAKKGFVKTFCANRKMLLRPNSKFAVSWKVTTVICVFLEILQIIFRSFSWGKIFPTLLYSVSSSCLKDTLGWISFTVTFAIGVVCFLDVFISFWTGEIVRDEKTNMKKLVQKSFFNRWVFPGVLLQLIVNPTMAHVAKILHLAFWNLCDVGFSRIACIAMIFWAPARQSVDLFSAVLWEKTIEWHL